MTEAALSAAHGRTQANKHRLLTLEPPRPEKLAQAVRAGIWDTLRLFTEAPPKGGRDNFGFAAYRRWAELLTQPKRRLSWEKEFPPGGKMFAGLVSAFEDINTFGKAGCAERDVYAAFLEEASLLLDRPALRQAGDLFRRSAQAWEALSQALLPDETPPLGEARRLLLQRHSLFIEQGAAALPSIHAASARLKEIRLGMESAFPLDAAGVTLFRQRLAEGVLRLCEIEEQAVMALQEAMG